MSIYSPERPDEDEEVTTTDWKVVPSVKPPAFQTCRSSIHHYKNLAEGRGLGRPRPIHSFSRSESETFAVTFSRISERVEEMLESLSGSFAALPDIAEGVDVESALASLRRSIRALDHRLLEACSQLALESDSPSDELIDWRAVAAYASRGNMPTTHDEEGQPLLTRGAAAGLASVRAMETDDDESLLD